MPTPFTHLTAIDRLLSDDHVPAPYRAALMQERPAYLLGSVAPDARVDAPDPRAATHFYSYQEGITDAPWRVMLKQYRDALSPPADAAHMAFLAGYVAHLEMDAVWTVNMLGPHFAFSDWGKNQRWRFFLLHLMLIDMDDRDLELIPPDAAAAIHSATPTDDWLPFMPLDVLVDWQTLIYEQVRPGGTSQTLEIFGERVARTPAQLRELADDDVWMQSQLWDHVPRAILNTVEAQMYVRAREALVAYLNEYSSLTA